MTRLRGLILTIALCLGAATAQAACTSLRTAIIPGDEIDITLVQRGLRTALEDNNALLSDGRLGSYTRTRLVQFCGQFPLPDAVDSVTGTVTMAEEYGELAGPVPNWKAISQEAAFGAGLLPGDDDTVNSQILPLLGPPDATANALLERDGARDCASLNGTALDPAAQAGLLALSSIDPRRWPNATTLCTALDLAGGAAVTRGILSSLANIETALPGGVNQALSPDFALWLGEDIAARGPRLLGSDDGVVSLITDYRYENRPAAPRDFSPIYATLPASCARAPSGGITDFFALDQAALDSLVAPVDVTKLLGGLAEQQFASAAALSDAVTETLTGQVTQCTLDQINQAIDDPENLGRAFLLDADKTANLVLVESFAPNGPVVAEFVGLSAQSRAALLAGIRGALQTATTARIMAEVDAAAAVLAGAAEPVSETFDTLVADGPEFDPLPVNPTIGVTEATDVAIIANVTDPDFQAALRGTSFAPAPNAEVLQAAARSVLLPIAQDKITTIVNRDMVQLQTAIDTSWGLTDLLAAAIAAAPAVTAPGDITVTSDGGVGLNTLAGVEYPNARLFDAALAGLDPQPSANVLGDLRDKAGQSAPFPNDLRDMAVALPDCGCVTRREDFTEIYGFYPYWFAGLQNAAADDPNAIGRQVDFGVVSRAGFYGLEMLVGDGGDGTLIVQNEAQWYAGRRDFVNAAHQHRAQADLALQLTGWADWTDVQISTAIQTILTLTDAFPRTDTTDFRALWAAVPNALDPARVDGVTLIIDGYEGSDDDEGAVRLVAMITLLQSELEARGQTVNLAVDLTLNDDTADDPVFADLRPLLIGSDPIVDYVLVFLQRPTTNTKKQLRARMETGVFQGIDRTRVLRRIIPVIPPGGHENILQSAVTPTAEPAPFSQFKDDLVYFQDNFAGVGFWPTPDPAVAETAEIEAILAAEWFRPTLPIFLSAAEDDVDRACTFICPNRGYMALILAVIFALTVLLIWRSFYSGFVDRIAFGLGLAWLGGAAIFASVLALAVCDHASIVPAVLLFAMVAGVILLFAFYVYQSARNGPKP